LIVDSQQSTVNLSFDAVALDPGLLDLQIIGLRMAAPTMILATCWYCLLWTVDCQLSITGW